MKNPDWDLIRAFRATADAGSLAAAARELRLTQPTLSRQIAALEASLGVALFDRVGRRLVLTATGLGLLDHARAMATAAEALSLAAAGQVEEISGRVSISATDAVATFILPDIVAHLRETVPQIAITIIATDSLSNLQRREADIAIRHVRPTEPDLIARLVGETGADFTVSKDWVARHGLPGSFEDLAQADFLAFEPVERFVAHLSAMGLTVSADRCRIVCDNAVVQWEMLRRGLGVGLILRPVAAGMPGLVRLFPDRNGIPVPFWLVSHRALQTSRRIRVVFDAIGARIAEQISDRAGSRGKAVARPTGVEPVSAT